MGKKRVQLGKAGERLIEAALQKQQYTIVDRNWRCPAGEVDIVAKKDGEWYFVEVRTRSGKPVISPELGLTFRKRDRMEKVARYYLGQHATDEDCGWHLSFAAVIVNKSGVIERMTLYPDLEGEPLDIIRCQG
jgi:putative endonuclease